MRSTFHPLSLDDFGISSDQGFLPHDPRESVPDCQPLNDLGHELPKLLSTRTVRPFIEKQHSLLPSIPHSWEEQDYRAAILEVNTMWADIMTVKRSTERVVD